jgi:hypothetical protein
MPRRVLSQANKSRWHIEANSPQPILPSDRHPDKSFGQAQNLSGQQNQIERGGKRKMKEWCAVQDLNLKTALRGVA